jgi:hypothetical protein
LRVHAEKNKSPKLRQAKLKIGSRVVLQGGGWVRILKTDTGKAVSAAVA